MLGVAIAEFFGGQATLATGRDGQAVSRFCRRCIVSGLVSRGAQVLDFRLVPSQVVRHGINTQKLDGAVYISYFNRQVQVHVYDSNGRNLSAEGAVRIRELMKEIRDTGASITDIGSLMQYTNAIDDYVDYLLGIMKSRKEGRWLIDTQSDPIALVIEPLFSKANMEFTIFNPMLVGDGQIRSRDEFLLELSKGKYQHGVVIERDELLGATYYDKDGNSRHFSSFEELVRSIFSR